jgi:ABC-type spermidine/putrescine transport system permease subunit II
MKELFFNTLWLSLTLIVVACTVSILIGCIKSLKIRRRVKRCEKKAKITPFLK